MQKVASKFNKNKHNAEMQQTDPGTKVTGEFSTRGRIFPPNAQKWIFIISIVLVGEKYTEMTGHMPWLYPAAPEGPKGRGQSS